jgi:hypothetical protein
MDTKKDIKKTIQQPIKWLPQQDCFIEGKSGDITFFIKMKKVGIFTLNSLGIKPDEGKRDKDLVDSLYVLDKRPDVSKKGTKKIMAHEYKAYTIDKMKIVAELQLDYMIISNL